eukprot:CAMPEP_0194273278 /NCGR_PEP_ID=MMETSP0169-20130528/6646_1 /TAXON_ID=218684 /ORGANISM="Corethron pennatum, Strain L29A3" /LENGTH=333 /DNA_ID=CAMNT_0039016179 /DNA_START=671 /DNA_END=1673 /DNA_ORIENTATION=-
MWGMAPIGAWLHSCVPAAASSGPFLPQKRRFSAAGGLPGEKFAVAEADPFILAHVPPNDGLLDDDGVLSLPALDHVEALQRADNVLRPYGGDRGDLPDAEAGPAPLLRKEVEEDVGPVGPVADLPQVAEGLLGTAGLALALGDLVAQRDDELPVSRPLVLRKREYARQVVVLGALLLLAEVSHDVTPRAVALRDDVEPEGVHVVVEGLVVQKELGEEAQVLAVDALLLPVHLESGDRAFPVYFPAGGTTPVAAFAVYPHRLRSTHVLQAELAHVELVNIAVLVREGGEVPRLHLVVPHLDASHIFHLGNLLVLPLQRRERLSGGHTTRCDRSA